MTTSIPVLPLAGATLARGFAGLAAQVARLAHAVARAQKNRRDARILAGLDQHMLADIGINRADLNDAFSASVLGRPDRAAAPARARAPDKPSVAGAVETAALRRAGLPPAADQPSVAAGHLGHEI